MPDTLLDRIREEVRQAVIEGDAQDCSSPDCIADAVYEIVRVNLDTLTAAVKRLDTYSTSEDTYVALEAVLAILRGEQ